MRRELPYVSFYFLLALAILAALFFMPQPGQTDLPLAHGSSDLSGLDFGNTVYRTGGYWESWPEELYTPEDIAGGALPAPRFVERPEYKNITHATHRLRLKLPPGETYGLSMLTSEYAMRLYLDGEEIDSVGRPGSTREDTVHRSLERTYYFKPRCDTVEIIVQAANFVHDKGGAWPPRITIGTEQNIMQRNSANLAVSFFIVGTLMMAFLYHLGLFLLNRSRKTLLLFSICCLLLALLNKKLILLFGPNYMYEFGIRIEYVIHFLTFAVLVLFIEKLHPKLLHPAVTRPYYLLAALYILITLILDSRIFTGLIIYFEAVSLLIIAYVLVRLAAALRKRQLQYYLSFAGVLVLGLLGANDILYYRDIVLLAPAAGQFFMAPLGMVFFVFCFAPALSLKYAQTERAMQRAREKEQQLASKNASLDRVNRMKTELMAAISHEARTPLAVLASYAGLVSMELRSRGIDAQITADLDKIAYEAKRVAGLIDGMKRLTLRTAVKSRRLPLDLGELVGQTAALYRPMLKREGMDLEIHIEDDLPPILGNPEELTQVLFNLLQNAKNHASSGNVNVTAARKDNFLSVSVTDTGRGITPELLPHIFEKGVHSGSGGSGLGLPICREIVETHGGTIAILSKLNQGTSVTLTLPVLERGASNGIPRNRASGGG